MSHIFCWAWDIEHLFNGHNSISVVKKVRRIAAFAPKQKPFRESVSTNVCTATHAHVPLILIETNVAVWITGILMQCESEAGWFKMNSPSTFVWKLFLNMPSSCSWIPLLTEILIKGCFGFLQSHTPAPYHQKRNRLICVTMYLYPGVI